MKSAPTKAIRGKVDLPIDVKVRELTAQRAAILAKILKLERAGTFAIESDDKPDVEQRAVRLLTSDLQSFLELSRLSPERELFRLREDLNVHDRAIALGMERSVSEHRQRLIQVVAEAQPEWRALQRKRALILVSLIKANIEVDALFATFSCNGQRPVGLPLSEFSPKLFGTKPSQQVSGFWANEFLRHCVQMGIVTAKEAAI